MTMVFESQHPLVKHKLTLLRSTATKPKKFRELIRELAMLLCYEATADLQLAKTMVESPMGEAPGHVLTDKIGLIPILRAGLGMVDGIW
jgi:uracil phosphoribosyltransferase